VRPYTSLYSIAFPHWILIILGLILAFSITWLIIPSIVNVTRMKQLCSTPNGRSSHTVHTPTLGGVAIFIGFVLSTVIFAGYHYLYELVYIIAGLLIVFFIGIKDDLLIIDPLKKLSGQIFSILLISVLADIRITNLYGLLYITELPYVVSIILTLFVFIVIINGFNLIDGIDGLAAGTGLLTASVFGIWFWISGYIAFAIFSFAFVGSLSAFFYFNVFGKKNKIFMGDTGSLITGFIMAILACRFLQLELNSGGGALHIPSAPTVVCGVLIVPLFDSLRVFILRVKQGKSPFKADRQHLHHRLLQLKYTHLQATLILLSVNMFFIVLSYILRGIGIVWLMAVIIGTACTMAYILMYFVRQRTEKAINKVHSTHTIVDIWNERNKMKRILEKQLERKLVSHSKEKVHAE
jgi:UDP-N-acetylmuramyl pentapeptide phosphotransferase/UDP-N-acetylglucosamine-1-phosphate transferase